MRLPGICLVEQTEEKFRRIGVCQRKTKKKTTSDCNSRALLLSKSADLKCTKIA